MGVFLNSQVTNARIPTINGTERFVLQEIANKVDDYSEPGISKQTGRERKVGYASYFSRNVLSEESGVSQSAIKKAFKDLEDKGWIIRLDPDSYGYKNGCNIYCLNVAMLIRVMDYQVTCREYNIDRTSNEAALFLEAATTFLQTDKDSPKIIDFRTIYNGEPIPDWYDCVTKNVLPDQWYMETEDASVIDDSITNDDLSNAVGGSFSFPYRKEFQHSPGEWVVYEIGADQLDQKTGKFYIGNSSNLSGVEIDLWYKNDIEEVKEVREVMDKLNDEWSSTILRAIENKQRKARDERRKLRERKDLDKIKQAAKQQASKLKEYSRVSAGTDKNGDDKEQENEQ